MKAEELSNTVMLHENNRMNQSLNDFTQRLYNNNYKASYPSKTLSLVKPDDLPDPLPSLSKDILYPALYNQESSMCTIEIQMDRPEDTQDGTWFSLSHEFQLRFECQFIERLIDGFLLLCKEKPSVFVVVPHRSQRSSIKQLLENEKYQNLNIKADTVDRMQGQEADIVIVSYLFFDALQVATESEFLFDRRRLNVSISRAEKFCLFIGSESVFDPPVEVLGSPSCSDAYQHLMYFVECCKTQKSFFNLKVNANRATDNNSQNSE
uniref:DNA2/NAM7 helicase-like C-terminal domain-containing protein n=1 Tax=Vannella robusta TaxID=1487602 RepID=A0A7S4HNP5_9EUKA|mmetsp:Transcript_13404/g.16876  ORF Transcript_13404/g.16876 Transcript_13404/m.16876 type:complete len:265 (+) Transcript_13404:144-938(+)